MKGNNQYAESRKNILEDAPETIAKHALDAATRRRGRMVIFVKPNGTVRVMREDLLENDTGVGVVCSVSRHDSVVDLIQKLKKFRQDQAEYLGVVIA